MQSKSSHPYKMRKGESPNSQRGAAILFTVTILSMVFFMLSGSVLTLSVYQTRERARYEVTKNEFGAAEEGLAKTVSHLQFLIYNRYADIEDQMETLDDNPPIVDGYDVQMKVTPGASETITLATGPWAGYPQTVQDYAVLVVATAEEVAEPLKTWFANKPGVAVQQTIRVTSHPLWYYAIFYDPTMEIAPGATMYIKGRIHCNDDAYFGGAEGDLYVLDHVNVHGNLVWGRHPLSGKTTNAPASAKDVFFLSTSQSPPSSWASVTSSMLTNLINNSLKMKNTTVSATNKTYLSHDDSGTYSAYTDDEWYQQSMARWGMNVQDSAQGATYLAMPIPTVDDPHELIERASSSDSDGLAEAKYENQAGLRIVEKKDASGNVVYNSSTGYPVLQGLDANGNTVNLYFYYKTVSGKKTYYAYNPTTTSVPSGGTDVPVVSFSKFYNSREGKMVSALNIDVANLIACSPTESGLVPSNGIVYVSNSDTSSGVAGVVRVKNATTLPQGTSSTGYSIITDDPLYVWGNYNTTSKKMSMLAGDAVTALSNGWLDANAASSSSALSSRIATATTVNAVCINGIVASGNSKYSGGVENYFRLLENWSGVTLTFRGSVIMLYNSSKATGSWYSATEYYKAANRDWGWDSTLQSIVGPPGAPYAPEIYVLGWEQVPYDDALETLES
jgi:hypothetical protein